MANKQQQQTTTTSTNNHRQQTTTLTQQYILPFSVPTKTLGKWGREIWYINTTATTMTTNTILYNAYKSHLLQCFMTNLLLGESKGKKHRYLVPGTVWKCGNIKKTFLFYMAWAIRDISPSASLIIWIASSLFIPRTLLRLTLTIFISSRKSEDVNKPLS